MLNLIGVVIAFTVAILLIRKKYNFGISLILGSIIIGIFSLQTIEFADIPKAMLEATIYHFEDQPLQSIVYSFDYHQLYAETIELALLMTLIFILAKLMQETGAIKKLIDSMRTFFSNGGTLGAIPAIYGLMPVPGGALFSAPMMDEEGDKYKINKDEKNFLNVWFRHIWFAVYPISSAMILICSDKFSNINIYYLVAINIPAFIASIAIGIFYIRKFIEKAPKQEKNTKKDYSGLVYLLPPIVPLFFYGLLQFVDFPQIRSFLIGIIFSIILLYFITKIKPKKFLQIIKKSLTWKLALAIFGIMIFREMFETSGATLLIADIIGGLPFPAIIVIITIPILLGVLTGYNLGAVAIAEQIADYLIKSSVTNAVNVPSVSDDVLAQVGPYITLGEMLGSLHMQLARGGVEEVALEYGGALAEQNISPITVAFLKGLFTPILKDAVNFVNAPIIARDRGIKIIESRTDRSDDFTNVLSIRVSTDEGENVLVGTVFGKNEPRLVRLNNFRLEVLPAGHLWFPESPEEKHCKLP